MILIHNTAKVDTDSALSTIKVITTHLQFYSGKGGKYRYVPFYF